VLYNGDELGLPNAPVAPGQARDPRGRVDPERNRDLGRTPMAWSRARHAGFTRGETPWLPLPGRAAELSVEAQCDEPASTLSLTRRLIELRREHPALRAGSYHALPVEGDDCLAYVREASGERLFVVANFAGEERVARLPMHRGRVLMGTEGQAVLQGHELRLAPYEGAIVIPEG
jgi:alpha-glucosidase